MSENRIVFICFLRLYHMNREAFDWACTQLGLPTDLEDLKNEEFIAELSELCEADFISCGNKFAIRNLHRDISIWKEEDEKWTREDDEFLEMIRKNPVNPLRLHQENYLPIISASDEEDLVPFDRF